MAKCRSCHADILWVTMDGTGKANPLDAEASEKGNVEVFYEKGRPMGRMVLDGPDRLIPPDLYLSHFATCPNAKEHRQR